MERDREQVFPPEKRVLYQALREPVASAEEAELPYSFLAVTHESGKCHLGQIGSPGKEREW